VIGEGVGEEVVEKGVVFEWCGLSVTLGVVLRDIVEGSSNSTIECRSDFDCCAQVG
jgi:hypothetical protein